MTWTRWWLTVILSTVAAIVVSIGAGDFDEERRAGRKAAAIALARESSGVDGRLVPPALGNEHER